MKNIQNYIYESTDVEQPNDVVLHFKNNIAAFLYCNTFDYEITSGKYDNAKPINHSDWVDTAKFIVDGNEYYTASFPHSKNNYNFAEFTKYVNEKSWGIRLICDSRFIKAIDKLHENLDLNDKEFNSEYISNIAFAFYKTLNKNKDATFEDSYQFISEYGLRIQQYKYCSEKYFDAFKNTSYTIEDFKSDIKSMCKTINIYKLK